MELLIAALALGTLALGAYASARRLHRPSDRARLATPGSRERGIDQLQPTDALVQDGTRTLVARQVWRYRDNERQWREARLQGDGQPRWLLVEVEPAGELLLGQRIDAPPIAKTPARQLEHDGQVYLLERRGRAERTTEDAKQASQTSQMDYWDYRGAGDLRVWLRHDADGYACFAGRSVPRHLIEFLPT